ncbi:MAG TPA: phage tail protein [Blastocatellia bacterium]
MFRQLTRLSGSGPYKIGPTLNPLPVFRFIVEWGDQRVGFSEVDGLTQENQAIEYREGSFPEYSAIKMPGLRKFPNVTLKRGIIKSDNPFAKWLSTVKLNAAERRDLVISLLNEEHRPAMVWKIHHAFPVKVEGPDLKASGNEVAIESIEIAHEGLELQKSNQRRRRTKKI